jgi:hypothetical protein
MQRWRNISIKRKLTLVIMLTTGAALLLACGGFTVHDLIAMRHALEAEVNALGKVVGIRFDAETFDALVTMEIDRKYDKIPDDTFAKSCSAAKSSSLEANRV